MSFIMDFACPASPPQFLLATSFKHFYISQNQYWKLILVESVQRSWVVQWQGCIFCSFKHQQIMHRSTQNTPVMILIHWPWEMWWWFYKISEHALHWIQEPFCEATLRWKPQMLVISQYCLGNCLVPSGNMPLPEPTLTEIYAAIWRH